ncbi:FtsK-like DNA translocase [Streptomyces phage Tomas]|uniref:FtsK-like DNA translocase n=1 Tax=Streptomyces phage Tomas TaxID=2914443 RepID=A0AA49BRS0_9CAUD|nr:FtsK/SpoIIIE-like protein [Streptomyces phage Tomas]UMO76296.1 FtsK-like DNA translocase [Streptomyces phage Tomas]
MVDFNKRHSKELVKRPDTDLETTDSRSFRLLEKEQVQGVFRHVSAGAKKSCSSLIDWMYAAEYRIEIAKARNDGNHEKARKLRIEQQKTAQPRRKRFYIGVAAGLALLSYLYTILGPAVIGAAIIALMITVAITGAEHIFNFDKEEDDDPLEPFPIADARNRDEAQECLRRALLAEGITPRTILEPVRYNWGWEIPVVLRKGTPADVMNKVSNMETLMRLPSDGMLIASTRFRAEVIVRLMQNDPFTDIPPIPYAEPLSRSIKNKYKVAQRMDGKDIELSLLRNHAVVIAAPGGGKSMFMRALADITTSCRDCVTWDIDPGGNGLEVFGHAVARRGRTEQEIEELLTEAIEYAKIRAKKLTKLGMGDNWNPTREHPALVIFIDEFIQLNTKCKGLAVDLIRIGRKAAISVVMAAQQATKDVLGAAIADSVSIKVMFASRHADIPIVFGEGAIGMGWRPDRLHPASGEDIEDAGKCYIMGGGSREPYLYKVFPMYPEDAIERGDERADEGIVELDKDTYLDVTVTDITNKRLYEDIVDVFENFDEHDWLPANILIKELKGYGHSLTARQLHETLGESGRESRIWEGSKYKVAGYFRRNIEKHLEK